MMRSRPSASPRALRVAAAAAVASGPERLEPTQLVVTLTVRDLAELVRDAALEAAAAALAEPRPRLLDRAGLAQALGVGTTTVDRLRGSGLPALWIGDSPRFDLAACLDWLRSRGRAE